MDTKLFIDDGSFDQWSARMATDDELCIYMIKRDIRFEDWRRCICRNELVRMTVETVIVRVFQSQQTNRNYGAYQLHFGSGYCLYFNRRLETGK